MVVAGNAVRMKSQIKNDAIVMSLEDGGVGVGGSRAHIAIPPSRGAYPVWG